MHLALAFACLSLSWTIVSIAADPAGRKCAENAVTVHGASDLDHADVCHGARLARSFLAQWGLDKRPELAIEVVARPHEEAGRSAAGYFLRTRNRAYVLAFSEFRKKKSWFGVPITRELYRSLAAHESAHAIAAAHFTIESPSIQSKEYIAYVTMFSTMPENLRAEALQSRPGGGFADLSRASSYVYLFDTERFGAESYRHFAAHPDGRALLRDILSGRVLAE